MQRMDWFVNWEEEEVIVNLLLVTNKPIFRHSIYKSHNLFVGLV